MTMYQNQNQVSQTPLKGDCANNPNPNTISAQITSASGSTLYPASAVKLVAGTANQILVDKAATTDQIFGFVIRNPKKNARTANDKVELALPNSIMWMESNGAFNRGQMVEYAAANDQVIVWGGSNTAIGVALDTATGANQLVRVYVRTVIDFSSSSSSSSCRSSSSSSSSSAT